MGGIGGVNPGDGSDPVGGQKWHPKKPEPKAAAARIEKDVADLNRHLNGLGIEIVKSLTALDKESSKDEKPDLPIRPSSPTGDT